MLLRTDDTIVAIASAPGGAIRGIVRVAGPHALGTLGQWFRSHGEQALPKVASIVLGHAILNEHGDRPPGVLYVWPNQRSYAGQPTLEFHTLGSPPLLQLLVQAICRSGARVAEPGEFTLRAFLAGRLDLTQAEAVLGVIDAASSTQLSVALRQLAGGLAAPLTQLRSELLDLLAHLEAGLDFAEEDLDLASTAHLRSRIAAAHAQVELLAERMSSRTSSSDQPRVVLYGRPNVGKSSLLNALAGSQMAIVSTQAGTTRDYLSAEITSGGWRISLIDTAGVSEADNCGPVEQAAQHTTRQQQSEAQLRVLCLDATRPLDDWERDELARADEQRLVIWTKCDVAMPDPSAVCTSSTTGVGLGQLKQVITLQLENTVATSADVVAGTAARCQDSLRRALSALASAGAAIDHNLGDEFVAGDLRVALEELGRVAGEVYTDDILDRIFSRFCIGK